MTPLERAELLRFAAGGQVYLDSPEQRALLRKGMIRMVPDPPIPVKVTRRFAVITDLGRIHALKAAARIGELIAGKATRRDMPKISVKGAKILDE